MVPSLRQESLESEVSLVRMAASFSSCQAVDSLGSRPASVSEGDVKWMGNMFGRLR